MSGVLYRAFDSDDALLYVGATTKPGQRLYAHGHDKDWWTEVDRITLEHFPTREDAFAAESQAIDLEQPRYNLSRPRRVLTSEEIARRQAAREERDREWQERRDEEEATLWSPGDRVACTNCGRTPFRLPLGVLIVETDCPTCGVPGLELIERAAA